MKKEGGLRKDTLVSTIMSNSGLDEALGARGIRIVRTSVGDRYVVEEMLKNGYNLGGEQSGHIIFLDHTTTGDGVITALQVLKGMVASGRRLSELSSVMRQYPQVIRNVKVIEKRDLSAMPRLGRALKGVEDRLKGKGRVFVRYSGTEMLARITIEGVSQKEIEAMAEELAEVIKREARKA
jgi:phosphoglucosamine mutase